MGEIEEVAPEPTIKSVTEDELKRYIQSIVKRKGKYYEPAVISTALNNLGFPTDITDAPARITSCCAKFFEILESIGYEDFREDNPKQKANLLLKRVQTTALCSKMFQKMRYNPSL